MGEIVKGIAIITNHFKEQPVVPKIIYANRYLLNLINYNLEEVINKDPSNFFLNWNNDTFIEEIVQCVDQKIAWHGTLEVKDHEGNKQTKEFTITPVYNVTGEICYYSCTTDIIKRSLISIDPNLICLDDFVCSLWEYQEHFREVCDLSPANLLKITNTGTITYINLHAQEHFGFKNGDNIFDLITNDLDRTEVTEFFNNKQMIGKVSNLDFDVKHNNQYWCLHCKFWPISNKDKEIIGYSISISDITKNKSIAREILALRGA